MKQYNILGGIDKLTEKQKMITREEYLKAVQLIQDYRVQINSEIDGLNLMHQEDLVSDHLNRKILHALIYYAQGNTKFKLNINKELTKVCMFVSKKIMQNNLIPENTPISVAAGIVYFVSQCCNLNICKRGVYKVSEISEVTINKCFKKLEPMHEKLIPKAVLDKYT